MKGNIFNYINSSAFFSEYLPHIKSYKHKLRGKNGRGNAVDFTDIEKKEINVALKKLFRDFGRAFIL